MEMLAESSESELQYVVATDTLSEGVNLRTCQYRQVGSTIGAVGAENDGRLATYAWEEFGIYSQIGITWVAWNSEM